MRLNPLRSTALGGWEVMATYYEKKLYDRAMQTIATLKPCPYAGVVTADQVKLVLGEMLDIWPDSIGSECVSHGKP
jgi:hypothetical protein